MDLNALTPVELALYWADKGHRVLPVTPRATQGKDHKRPLIRAWQTNCTDDPKQILGWWTRWPDARVGIATGEPGYDVVDFDVADDKPGLAQLEKLLDLGIFKTGTYAMVATPSGGYHLYFRGSQQHNRQNDSDVAGVDLRGVGGMVVAAGNPGYRAVSGLDLALESMSEMDWGQICAVLAPETAPAAPPDAQPAPARPAVPTAASPPTERPRAGKTRLSSPASSYEHATGEESPLDWYCRSYDFETLLVSDGWTFCHESEGRRHFARPGKDKKAGPSGNLMMNTDGRVTLYNFSSSVDLPMNRAISAAQWYAHRWHAGDMKAAARAIRTRLMPQRQMAPAIRPAAPPTNGHAPAGIGIPTAAPASPSQSPGTELVPVSVAGTPEPVRQFWTQRPELAEIWWRSQVSAVSPWAVLGYLLAQVLARVGPHVVLPPLGQSGHASLNLLVAISGQSGEGKGEAGKVAKNLIGGVRIPTLKPGTGQGIAAAYTEMTQKEGPVQYNDTGYFNAAEISNLGAHADMQGSNLVGTLCEVYMAEELGEHYAKKELRRPVREGAYRFCLTVGVQPTNAHIILEHAETGLPQRFIWLPAFWEDAVLPANTMSPPAPPEDIGPWQAWPAILPGSLDPTLDPDLGWQPSDAAAIKPGLSKPKKDTDVQPTPVKDRIVLRYAPEVAQEIRLSRRSRQQQIAARRREGGSGGDLEGHLVLARIKVAAGLALYLDGSTYISGQIWDLSRWVMWVSNDTRIANQKELQDKESRKTAGRAAGRVKQDEIVREYGAARASQVIEHTKARILHLLSSGAAAGDWQPAGAVNRRLKSTERKALRDDAGVDLVELLDDLVEAGQIQSREPSGDELGTRYRICP